MGDWKRDAFTVLAQQDWALLIVSGSCLRMRACRSRCARRAGSVGRMQPCSHTVRQQPPQPHASGAPPRPGRNATCIAPFIDLAPAAGPAQPCAQLIIVCGAGIAVTEGMDPVQRPIFIYDAVRSCRGGGRVACTWLRS